MDNAVALLSEKDFIIGINLDDKQATEIESQLVKGEKLSVEIIDWICENMPYFPRSFLEKDAIYRVERKDMKPTLVFSILIFTPLTFMALMTKVDEISGGFQITTPPVFTEEDFMEAEEEED